MCRQMTWMRKSREERKSETDKMTERKLQNMLKQANVVYLSPPPLLLLLLLHALYVILKKSLFAGYCLHICVHVTYECSTQYCVTLCTIFKGEYEISYHLLILLNCKWTYFACETILVHSYAFLTFHFQFAVQIWSQHKWDTSRTIQDVLL